MAEMSKRQRRREKRTAARAARKTTRRSLRKLIAIEELVIDLVRNGELSADSELAVRYMAH